MDGQQGTVSASRTHRLRPRGSEDRLESVRDGDRSRSGISSRGSRGDPLDFGGSDRPRLGSGGLLAARSESDQVRSGPIRIGGNTTPHAVLVPPLESNRPRRVSSDPKRAGIPSLGPPAKVPGSRPLEDAAGLFHRANLGRLARNHRVHSAQTISPPTVNGAVCRLWTTWAVEPLARSVYATVVSGVRRRLTSADRTAPGTNPCLR